MTDTRDFEIGVAIRQQAMALRRAVQARPDSRDKEMTLLTAGEALNLLSIDLVLAQRHLDAAQRHFERT